MQSVLEVQGSNGYAIHSGLLRDVLYFEKALNIRRLCSFYPLDIFWRCAPVL